MDGPLYSDRNCWMPRLERRQKIPIYKTLGSSDGAELRLVADLLWRSHGGNSSDRVAAAIYNYRALHQRNLETRSNRNNDVCPVRRVSCFCLNTRCYDLSSKLRRQLSGGPTPR